MFTKKYQKKLMIMSKQKKKKKIIVIFCQHIPGEGVKIGTPSSNRGGLQKFSGGIFWRKHFMVSIKSLRGWTCKVSFGFSFRHFWLKMLAS